MTIWINPQITLIILLAAIILIAVGGLVIEALIMLGNSILRAFVDLLTRI